MEFTSTTQLSKAGKGLAQRRFTIFASAIIQNGSEIFQEVYGSPAENESVQKLKFRSEYSTIRDGVKYSAVLTGPRLDLIVSPQGSVPLGTPTSLDSLASASQSNDVLADFAVIPCVPESVRISFFEAAQRTLVSVPDITRLAFGEFFFLSATSKLEAYEKLNIQLPDLKLNPVRSSDLFYRINRSREIVLGDKKTTINRLAEWTAPALTMQIKSNPVDTTTIVAFAAATRTDINTALSPDLSKFGDAELKSITRMLFEFSAELIEKGDMP